MPPARMADLEMTQAVVHEDGTFALFLLLFLLCGLLPQGHRSRTQSQGHLRSWLSSWVAMAKTPAPSITSRLPDPIAAKATHPSAHPIAPNQAPDTDLPAGNSLCLGAVKISS